LDKTTFPIERRHSRRITVRCDAELTSNLSILGGDANVSGESLIFFGETKDLSNHGVSLILPSISIDKKYCSESNRVKISLHLPEGSVALEVEPVHCVSLNPKDTGQGSLLGGRIVSMSGHEGSDIYRRFLELLHER
jgi:hypothetical protein